VPGIWEWSARAKQQAWYKVLGMPQLTAMRRYIAGASFPFSMFWEVQLFPFSEFSCSLS